MRIGIALFQFYQGRVGGAGEYIARVVPELVSELAPDDELWLLGNPQNLAPFAGLTDRRVQRLEFSESQRELNIRRLVDLIVPGLGSARLAARVNSVNLDVVLYPQQSLFPRGVRARRVVTVVDLLHQHFPHHFNWGERWIRHSKDRQLIAGGNELICISGATCDDLKRCRGVRAEKCHVVYLAGRGTSLGAEPRPTEPSPANVPYLFYPANAYRHKNHARLIEAFRQFRAEHPQIPGRLVLCGLPDRRLDRLIAAADAGRGEIVHEGFVAAARIQALYAGCRAVILPTRFEGFGMPLIEAMEHGRPIACHDLPVFRELAGDAVRYFDASTSEGIARELTALFTAPSLPVDQAAYRRILSRLSWSRCAAETFAILARAAGVEQPVRRRAA